MANADTSTLKIDVKYNEIVCIGLGLSGVCLGVQLRRKWNFRNMHFYDRNESHSGTWWVNHYPGAACDVPIIAYSFSFAQGQPWSRLLPGYNEIRDYVSGVISEYDLSPHMTFQTECEAAIWDEGQSLWSLHMRNIISGKRFIHKCRILFSAVGLLSQPYIPAIPGAATFRGESFHTARWKDEVSLDGKDIIILGNGCTASQLIPAIAPRAGKVTQIFKTPQWLLFYPNLRFSPAFLRILKSLPLLGRLLRFLFFGMLESEYLMFPMNRLGERMRKSAEEKARNHVLKNAPEKYHKILIPDFAMGCKRRIYDADSAYVKTLHLDNMLLTKETAIEIKSNGVLTEKNFYPADIIVYATGFRTNNNLEQLRVRGENEVWLDKHWAKIGGPAAYNGISVAGYPNFFMLYGPNTNTGHTSVVITTENAIKGALKLITPLLEGRAIKVKIRENAYAEWAIAVQAATNNRVFSREICRTWYTSKTGWNGTVYPWSQIHFWWRQTFPIWKDWEYTYIDSRSHIGESNFWITSTFLAIVVIIITYSFKLFATEV